MATRIASQQPVDANDKALANSALIGIPLATTYDATISAATSITLNAATTSIEICAIDKGVFMRYQASVSSSAFDGFIPANTCRLFQISSGTTVVSVIEEAASAHLVAIER